MDDTRDLKAKDGALRDRIRLLIAEGLRARGRHRQLAEMSGISEDRWKNAWFGKQRYTIEMIQFICRQWPAKAGWLLLGEGSGRGQGASVRESVDLIVSEDALGCVEDLIAYRSSGIVNEDGPLHRIGLLMEGATGVTSRSVIEAAAIDALLAEVSRKLRM